jgi:hypothetical protein
MKRLAAWGAVALACTGCVVHEARIDIPPPPAVRRNEEPYGPTRAVLLTREQPAPEKPVLFRGPLPQDLRVSAWRRDQEGRLCRAESRVTTPLSWWQRFPCDAVTDLLPIDVVARSEAVIILAPVPVCDAAALAAAARADGYAHEENDGGRHAP